EARVFWGNFWPKIEVIFVEFSSEAAPGDARGITLREVVTASLAAEFRRQTGPHPGVVVPDRFDFLHTGRAQGIQTHSVLDREEMFIQLCLQEDDLLSAQKTLEERLLPPLAKAYRSFPKTSEVGCAACAVLGEHTGLLSSCLRQS